MGRIWKFLGVIKSAIFNIYMILFELFLCWFYVKQMQSTAISIHHLLVFKGRGMKWEIFSYGKSLWILFIFYCFIFPNKTPLTFSFCLSVSTRTFSWKPNNMWIVGGSYALLSMRMDQVCVMWLSRGLDRWAVGWTVDSVLAFSAQWPKISFQGEKSTTSNLKSKFSSLCH